MSNSSLWGMDKNFNGEELVEFENSWFFAPIVWNILLDKYIPRKLGDDNRTYLGAVMLNKNIAINLNEKINNSLVQEDRILWEFGNQQVFFTKDKELIAESIDNFLILNSIFATDLGDHIWDRFSEIAEEIRNIDEHKFPYLIFKNTSIDDNVERWFYKYNEQTGNREFGSLKDWNGIATEFVIIEDNKIIKFINNLDYLKNNIVMEVSENV